MAVYTIPVEIMYDILERVTPSWRWGSSWKAQGKLKLARVDLAWFLSLRLVNRLFDDFVIAQFRAAIKRDEVDQLIPICYGTPTASTMAMGRRLLMPLVQGEESPFLLINTIIKGGSCAAEVLCTSDSEGSADELQKSYSNALVAVYVALAGEDIAFDYLYDFLEEPHDAFDENDIGDQDWQYAALMAAAYLGRINDMKKFIALGLDINRHHNDKGKWLCPPLITGALNGEEAAVRFLIEQGADPHIVAPETGGNAIHCAALGGHARLVQYLVDLGVDVDREDDGSNTAVSLAAGAGHADVVRILVAKGVKTYQFDCWDRTPMLAAAGRGYGDVVRELLKSKNLDLALRTDEPRLIEQTALDVAAVMGRENIVEMLMAHPDVRGKGPMVFRHALIRGRVSDVEEILALKSTMLVEYQREYGETALHTAAGLGREKMTRFLLARKVVHIDEEDYDGDTALHRAVRSGSLGTVQAILHAVFLDDHNVHEYHNSASALRVAASIPKLTPGIFEALARHPSIHPNVTDGSGRTPLAIAVATGRLDCANLLLAREGVIIGILDHARNTLFHHAVRSGKQEVVARVLEILDIDNLRKRNRDGETVLSLAAELGHWEIGHMLFNASYKLEGRQKSLIRHSVAHLNATLAELQEEYPWPQGPSSDEVRSARASTLQQAISYLQYYLD